MSPLKESMIAKERIKLGLIRKQLNLNGFCRTCHNMKRVTLLPYNTQLGLYFSFNKQ